LKRSAAATHSEFRENPMASVKPRHSGRQKKESSRGRHGSDVKDPGLTHIMETCPFAKRPNGQASSPALINHPLLQTLRLSNGKPVGLRSPPLEKRGVGQSVLADFKSSRRNPAPSNSPWVRPTKAPPGLEAEPRPIKGGYVAAPLFLPSPRPP